jgi:hypothetical protein
MTAVTITNAQMSALGHKRTRGPQKVTSALPRKQTLQARFDQLVGAGE